jgi:hypothetical protein
MQIRSTILIAAVLLAGPVAAHAPNGANATQAAAKPANSAAPASAEKKICKRPDTSGSRLTEKVCLTKEQWQKVEAEG